MIAARRVLHALRQTVGGADGLELSPLWCNTVAVNEPLCVMNIHVAHDDGAYMIVESRKLTIKSLNRQCFAPLRRTIPHPKQNWTDICMQSVPSQL